MRGALGVVVSEALDPGIIPAYAGSTQRSWWPAACTGDHPRVCGEHFALSLMLTMAVGSSPRMRGALAMGLRHRVRLRIIPAYAGSTYSTYQRSVVIWDHPRVCGEHVLHNLYLRI